MMVQAREKLSRVSPASDWLRWTWAGMGASHCWSWSGGGIKRVCRKHFRREFQICGANSSPWMKVMAITNWETLSDWKWKWTSRHSQDNHDPVINHSLLHSNLRPKNNYWRKSCQSHAVKFGNKNLTRAKINWNRRYQAHPHRLHYFVVSI